MPALVWDEAGKKLYHTGVSKCALYPYDASQKKFGPGVAWNGITSITASPSGAESNPKYADNIKYIDLRSAEEFGATIEALMYPDEWLACDGSIEAATGVTFGQQPRKMFGLAYNSILGNDTELDSYGYIIHLIYNATAAPSERQYQTVNDSPEAMSMSWELKTTPLPVAGHRPVAHIEINSKKIAKEKLVLLEKKLYGDDSGTPELPLPAEILQIVND